MKTETNSMRIVKPEKESEKAATESQQEKASGKPKCQPVQFDAIPEDSVFIYPFIITHSVFIRSTDVCKLLNISNSTLRNLRASKGIPFYKLGGTFLYNKEEIMNYLASNYSRRI